MFYKTSAFSVLFTHRPMSYLFPFFSPHLQFLDEDLKAGKYKGNDYSQYSPWSCDTIGSYIGTKDAKPKDVVAAGSAEMMVCLITKPLLI